MISKAGKCVGVLGRLCNNLMTHSADVAYISLIRPILKYCDILWGCCGEGNSQALEAIQKRARRIQLLPELIAVALQWTFSSGQRLQKDVVNMLFNL